jgi:hypothetical protein
VKTKTTFAFPDRYLGLCQRQLMELVAGVEDFETAVATYWAAVRRWPRAKITPGRASGEEELARIFPDQPLRARSVARGLEIALESVSR